jgi:hypothetical protein
MSLKNSELRVLKDTSMVNRASIFSNTLALSERAAGKDIK